MEVHKIKDLEGRELEGKKKQLSKVTFQRKGGDWLQIAQLDVQDTACILNSTTLNQIS